MTLLRHEMTAVRQPFLNLLEDCPPPPRGAQTTARLLPHGRSLVACAYVAGEFLLLAALGLAVLLAAPPAGQFHRTAWGGAWVAALAAGAATSALAAQDAYAMRVLAAARLSRRAILGASGAGGLCCLAGLEVVHAGKAGAVSLLWSGTACLLLAGARAALAPVLAARFRRGRLLFRVAVLGKRPDAERVRAGLRDRREAGIVLCQPAEADLVPERWDALERFCGLHRIDAIVLDPADATTAAGHLSPMRAEIFRAAPAGTAREAAAGRGAAVRAMRRHPLGMLDLTRLHAPVFTQSGLLAKTAFDMILGGLVLVAMLPALALVAVAIRLDSRGPVLFRQPRIGYGNVTFHVLKFRTMYHDKADMLATRQTERGDPRVTRVGRLLRRLSIDELPQLLNVLRGEMSLVGPRPHAQHTSVDGALLDRAVPDYALRHRVKPGITGWAQVNGARGALSTREQLQARLQLDLDYIARWSLLLDIQILAITLRREIFSTDAY